MTDDRLNILRDLAHDASRKRKKMTIEGYEVAALLDMIDRLREEIEASQERTVEELCGS